MFYNLIYFIAIIYIQLLYDAFYEFYLFYYLSNMMFVSNVLYTSSMITVKYFKSGNIIYWPIKIFIAAFKTKLSLF